MFHWRSLHARSLVTIQLSGGVRPTQRVEKV